MIHKGEFYMKKGFCILLSSALLLTGTVPTWAKEERLLQEPHVYRGIVGTTNFYRDDVLQSSDAEIYLKDGYVMLPVRTFFTSIYPDAQIYWNSVDQQAGVLLGESSIFLYVKENKIVVNREEQPVVGKMEVKNGRLFIPLRNWLTILNECGYQLTDADFHWNSAKQEVTVTVRENQIIYEENLKTPVISGEGQAPVYAMVLTDTYDEVANLGDGYFFGINDMKDHFKRTYDILDSSGKVKSHFAPGEIFEMRYLGEGMFCVYTEKWEQEYVMDENGQKQFDVVYDSINDFQEGLACVRDEKDGQTVEGYVDANGTLQIPLQFASGGYFSEERAVVRDLETRKYGVIDKKGNYVAEPKYKSCKSFQDGMALVQTEQGYGYINLQGEEVIALQYVWASDFYDGTAYVLEEQNGPVWLINTKGDKVRKMADQPGDSYKSNAYCLRISQDVMLPSGIGENVDRYYDKTGEISMEQGKLLFSLSEGLCSVLDEKTQKYGYVDETGKMVISPVFDEAERFRDGYAVVKVQDQYGIVKNPLLQK